MTTTLYQLHASTKIGSTGTLDPHVEELVRAFGMIAPYEGRRPRHPEQPTFASAVRPSAEHLDNWYLAQRQARVDNYRGITRP